MRADIHLQRALTSWEPWRAMATVITASAAVFGSLGAIIGYHLATAFAHR